MFLKLLCKWILIAKNLCSKSFKKNEKGMKKTGHLEKYCLFRSSVYLIKIHFQTLHMYNTESNRPD